MTGPEHFAEGERLLQAHTAALAAAAEQHGTQMAAQVIGDNPLIGATLIMAAHAHFAAAQVLATVSEQAWRNGLVT